MPVWAMTRSAPVLPVIVIAPALNVAVPPAAVPSLVRTLEIASSTEICVASDAPPVAVMVKVVEPTVPRDANGAVRDDRSIS